ncbi:MAG: DUF503 domain-containing protein [Anaerolineaceae bacterium]
MPTAVLTLHLHLPGCASLKEKRSRIQPILARLHREFNLSTAELDRQDAWQDAVLGLAVISSDADINARTLETALRFVQDHYPDEQIVDHQIEFI